MMAQNDASTAARPSHIAAAKRLKRQAEHLKRVAVMEPGNWQEKHDPTESVQVVLAHTTGMKIDDRGEHVVRITRTIEQGRRRTVDARLWGSLDIDQQEAMIVIESAWRTLVAGMGMKPASVERKDGGKGDMTDRQGAATADYNNWIREVDVTMKVGPDGEPMKLGRGKAKNRWTLERLSPEAATDIICEGRSIDEVAQARKHDTRWVRENLIQSLTVWLYRTNKRRRPMPFVEPNDTGLTMNQVVIRNRNRRIDKILEAESEHRRVIRKVA